jgi:hypothetical protein
VSTALTEPTPFTRRTGTATHWPEYLLYNLETEEEERLQEVKNAAVPYNNVGLLEVRWTPLAGKLVFNVTTLGCSRLLVFLRIMAAAQLASTSDAFSAACATPICLFASLFFMLTELLRVRCPHFRPGGVGRGQAAARHRLRGGPHR